VILSVMVLAAAELGLAAVIGGPYCLHYSLIGAGLPQVADAVRAVRNQGLLFIAILAAALAGVLAVTSYLPFLLPLVTTAGEVAWCAARYRRWRAAEAQASRDRELAAQELQLEPVPGPGPAGGPAI
jgi:hypothetical protein